MIYQPISARYMAMTRFFQIIDPQYHEESPVWGMAGLIEYILNIPICRVAHCIGIILGADMCIYILRKNYHLTVARGHGLILAAHAYTVFSYHIFTWMKSPIYILIQMLLYVVLLVTEDPEHQISSCSACSNEMKYQWFV